MADNVLIYIKNLWQITRFPIKEKLYKLFLCIFASQLQKVMVIGEILKKIDALGGILFASCQDKDINIAAPILQAPSAESITGALQGDDYVWTWSDTAGKMMQVTLVVNGTKSGAETVTGNSYTHKTVDTGIQYQYIFKLTDGENFSKGVIKEYTREGAQKISGITMSQVEKTGGYDAKVEWNKAADAERLNLEATNGTRRISETLSGSTTSYIIENVEVGETWTVTIVAENAKGSSLSSTGSLRIGKTAVGFLSIYPTPEEHIANSDDDEAAAWLWFASEYPTGQFVYFGDVKSETDVEPFRVLFWLRDLENVGEAEVLGIPEVVEGALPYLQSWYKNGGSMLLWSHAITFSTHLGRIPAEAISNNDRAIGTGVGGWNPDVWKIAIQLNPGGRFTVDNSTHPLFKGIEYETTDRTKLVAMKGAGWTEDHNCLFFNYPTQLTGLGNQDPACYEVLTKTYGIYPLATWDSQIDWVSQLNIWEARQGDSEFQGTLLCIGNGGCEFSLKNEDGTPDKSALPKNNAYQGNILKLAKNGIEYLKTR